jgi:hypothetical protein
VRAYEALGEERWLAAAVKNADWAVGRAFANDWLPDNCLLKMEDESALTHTIAYSIRGILEVGVAAGRQDLIERAVRMSRMVAARQREDGALPARYLPDWKTRVDWTCVTGNSQMAINWLRLAQITGDDTLKEPAIRANRFNMSIQDLNTSGDRNVRGALKGSHPINGEYMTYRYPNWATKFFMDGLMLEQKFGRRPEHRLTCRWFSTFLHQHFERFRVAEKAARAGAQAVRAGLEHHHQVARLGARQFHLLGQQVERRA